MSDQLTTMETSAVAALAALKDANDAALFRTVKPWSDCNVQSLEDVMGRLAMPAAAVAIAGGPGREVGDDDLRLDVTVSVLVLQSSQRSQDDARAGNAATGRVGALELVGRVIDGLHMHGLGMTGAMPGLHFASLSLVHGDSRLVAYGVEFKGQLRFVPPA